MNMFNDIGTSNWIGPILVACIVLGTIGCRDSVPEDKSGASTVSETVNEAADLATSHVFVSQQIAQLEETIDEAKELSMNNELDQVVNKLTAVLHHRWPNDVNSSRINELNAEAFVLRGQAFVDKGFAQIAVKDFGDAIRFGDVKIKAAAYVQRAKAHGELGLWARAVEDCTQAIRLQPDHGQAFQLRARALTEVGEMALARASLQEA